MAEDYLTKWMHALQRMAQQTGEARYRRWSMSVEVFAASRLLGEPAERRLAFRELGLSIGLHGIERVRSLLEREREVAILADRLLEHRQLAPQIEDFWCDAVHRHSRTWLDHREINAVMLATSLEPSGYLDLRLAVEGEGNDTEG